MYIDSHYKDKIPIIALGNGSTGENAVPEQNDHKPVSGNASGHSGS